MSAPRPANLSAEPSLEKTFSHETNRNHEKVQLNFAWFGAFWLKALESLFVRTSETCNSDLCAFSIYCFLPPHWSPPLHSVLQPLRR